MKVVLVIICAIVIANTLADGKQLPQLLIYEVSEKNGEPQVRLIKTQNRINLNDFIEKDIKQSKDWYPYNDRNDWSTPNKYRDNLQKSKYSGQSYRSNNGVYKKLKLTDNGNIKNHKKDDNDNKKNMNDVVKYIQEQEAKEKLQKEEAKKQQKWPKLLEYIEKLEQEKKAKEKLLNNGQVYVGTMNLNDADKFLRNLIKPRGSGLGRSKSALRTGLDEDLVDERTAPPPPKHIYVPDYYD